jgi:hypothetical protein
MISYMIPKAQTTNHKLDFINIKTLGLGLYLK